MSQVSRVLRRQQGGYLHCCPACHDTHQLPDTWAFNGNVEKPSFSPSFKHGGVMKVTRDDGTWYWLCDADANPIPRVCHYVLTDGVLNFCNDCTHSMGGQAVPLPDLPEFLRDDYPLAFCLDNLAPRVHREWDFTCPQFPESK